MNGFLRYAAAAAVAMLMVVAFALAQERREPDKTKPAPAARPAQANPQTGQPKTPQQPRQVAPGQAGAWQMQGDSQLATWLFAESEAKIEIAKFAIERTKNEDVAELARQEVFDHSEFLEHLRRFGPLPSQTVTEQRIDPFAPARTAEQPGRAAADNRPATSPQRPINNPFAVPPAAGEAQAQASKAGHQAMAGRVDLARVKQEIARECVTTFKKEAAEKKAADFDKCYVGYQIMGHLHMADTLKVMKKFASADLRTVLEEGEKTADEHLDHARTLMEELDRKVERTALKD